MMFWLVFLAVSSCALASPQQMFKPVVEMKQLDFLFPSEQERYNAMQEGRFAPANCTPVDMDVQYAREYLKK